MFDDLQGADISESSSSGRVVEYVVAVRFSVDTYCDSLHMNRCIDMTWIRFPVGTDDQSLQMMYSDMQGTDILESSISGLVVECIVAIDVTRVRFPAGTYFHKKLGKLC